MVLSVFRFRHSLRKILTGNTLCHITGMRKWNFYISQKEVWCCVPRTVPGCSRKDISILLIPAHCTDCLETVRFPTIMRWFSGWICWIFSRQIPARPLIWYLFAPENICFPMARISLRSSLIRLVHWSKRQPTSTETAIPRWLLLSRSRSHCYRFWNCCLPASPLSPVPRQESLPAMVIR